MMSTVVFSINMNEFKTFFQSPEPEPVITAVPPSDRDSVTRKGSVTSVLSDSETKTCPGEHSVCCVRAGAHQYHPSCNFSQGNRVEEHGENPEGLSTKKCISSFLMNVSCSGAGSYYCAVATYEQRFPGNRSKPDTKGNSIICMGKSTYVCVLLR